MYFKFRMSGLHQQQRLVSPVPPMPNMSVPELHPHCSIGEREEQSRDNGTLPSGTLSTKRPNNVTTVPTCNTPIERGATEAVQDWHRPNLLVRWQKSRNRELLDVLDL